MATKEKENVFSFKRRDKPFIIYSIISYWIAIIFYSLGIYYDNILRNSGYSLGVCVGFMTSGAMIHIVYSIILFDLSLNVLPLFLCSSLGILMTPAAWYISYYTCDFKYYTNHWLGNASLSYFLPNDISNEHCAKYPFNTTLFCYCISTLLFTSALFLVGWSKKKEEKEKVVPASENKEKIN